MPTIGLLRDELPRYWADLGLTGVAVEVGVYKANFSACILKHWPGHLHSVDPFVHQPDQADMLNHTQATMEQVYAEACQTLAPWTSTGRCTIHRQFSIQAAQEDWAHDLDVVYIDARHDFPNVMLDLVSWYPKVKSGGIIAGHDYLDGQHGPTLFGVKSAVQQFFTSQGYDVEKDVLVNGDPYPSWMLRVR